MFSERRRYIRFIPKVTSYLALGERFSKIGKIVDISVAGLAFIYMSDSENQKQEHAECAIFMSDNQFHLRGIPCLVVSDILNDRTDESNNILFPAISHRCGLKFRELSIDQKKNLEFFLKCYSIGLAKSDNPSKCFADSKPSR